jgi:hypothetical protein
MKILSIIQPLKSSFLVLLATSFLLSSCWAPRCPIQSCKSKYEHKHSDQVSGYFSPRKLAFPTFHYVWDKKRDDVASIKLEKQPRNKNTQKRGKRVKLFPWEKGYN